ncbi:hypothetical protein [Cellulomonas sp. HZM]|uniref:hypothetical protein n=1 Tax=Cellulomonas sp. HZM TaxID=1454010 RepID=UPI00049301FD|nr:hypothetical protein [Cellulomonas sp. HZM]
MIDFIDVLGRVLGDFRGTPVEHAGPHIVVLDPRQPEAAAPFVADPASWTLPGSYELRPLLVVGQNVTALDEVADDCDRALVEIASILQDFVADETGRPWPCVDTQKGRTVLEAALVDGHARWTSRGEPWCGIGALNDRD